MPTLPVLRELVGDLRQVASVRRVALLDGAEPGAEAIVFSTGGGLDFWVAAGRMLDIATLSWRGIQIGWQSPAGMRAPDACPSELRGFERGFGGFLNTCGFDHVRQPAGGRRLHGSASFAPARVTACGEDWDAGEPVLFCEGEAVSWRYGGGHRLRRRIEAPIGGSTIRIRDSVAVIGPEPSEIVTLYHFNLGYPAIGEGTEVTLDGDRVCGPLSMPEADAKPSTLHPAADGWSHCRVASIGGPAVGFRWRSDTLPWLQLWRDLRSGCGVLSVEPCSIGRLPDGSNEPSPPLAAGEARSFAVDIVVGEPVGALDAAVVGRAFTRLEG